MQNYTQSASIVSTGQSPVKKEIARTMRREMTGAETTLWQRLRGRKLNDLKFRRQQIIDGFIADFYCHEARLVVEADGAVHSGRQEYDADRDRIIATRNLSILRFTNSQICNDLASVLRQITAAAKSDMEDPNPAPLSGGEGLGVRYSAPLSGGEGLGVRSPI